MELFVINRYLGDKIVSGHPGSTSSEAELQEMFLRKIKQRKKFSKLSTDEKKDLKRKATKLIEDKQELMNDDNCNNSSHDRIKKKKFLQKKDEENNIGEKKEKEDKDEEEEREEKEEKDTLKEIKVKVKKMKVEKIEKRHSESEAEIIKPTEEPVEPEETEENSRVESNKEETDFLLLGNVNMAKLERIKRKLPNWLANPCVVSVDLKNLTCAVDSVPELDKIFIDQLKENNISHFFPVQSQIIPWLLKKANRPHMFWHNDICVSAPTGSGKTLAFVLPILQCLYKRIVPKIRALIVLPVQDLALQVYNVFKSYSKATDLNILLFSKKVPFEEEQSLICKKDGTGKYKTLVDIVITTPGRLVDHLTKTKGLCFDDLIYLVIDEADRVMENIQNDWLYHLNKNLSADCTRSYQIPIISYNSMIKKRKFPHKLLFSATLSQDPEKLQQLGLFQPKLFTSVVKSTLDIKAENQFIGKYTTPAELTEYFVCCTKMNKPLIVHHLISTKTYKNVLCFVNSTKATSRLAFVLKALCNKNIRIARLSANLTIKKRNSVLKKFSTGKIDVLISSDALARGIDIANVKYVISYDTPKFIKTYIHRIGRTGRAGKMGTSIVLLTSKEINHFQKMVQTAGKTSVQKLEISEDELNPYKEIFEDALTSLGMLLGKKQQRTLLKMKAKKISKLQASKGKLIEKSERTAEI